MHSKIATMAKIRDATDSSGGATFPNFMLKNIKGWEREGLIELHHGNTPGQVIARITDKGRTLAKKAMLTFMAKCLERTEIKGHFQNPSDADEWVAAKRRDGFCVNEPFKNPFPYSNDLPWEATATVEYTVNQ
jgi:hypothetical protein